ncbi:hypothetical protein [Aestuariivirga sp.]|uniref:hypothetical protein n=1 Tax=Aestuariivirga sp. TaxID=2650926 RepID=UPI0039E2D20B
MKKLLTVLVFFLLGYNNAMAKFVNNFEEWQKRNHESQTLYAMGLYDGQAVPNELDKNAVAEANGLDECARGLKLTGEFVASAITGFYEAHPEVQARSAMFVFRNQIEGVLCVTYINSERVKFGLAPWPIGGP